MKQAFSFVSRNTDQTCCGQVSFPFESKTPSRSLPYQSLVHACPSQKRTYTTLEKLVNQNICTYTNYVLLQTCDVFTSYIPFGPAPYISIKCG